MKRIAYLIALSLLSVLFYGNLSAQKTTLSGTVIEGEKNEPLENTMVTVLKGCKKQIIAYALTDNQGKFSLSVLFQDSLHISFSGLGYETQTFPLSPDKLRFQIKMNVKPYNLREVSVKATRIIQREDTLTYIVSNFSEVQDRTIGDVLKKMPGIEVSEKGEIRYQGLPISKFYIEGIDLLENKYGIATNNLPHKNVKSVEVLEHHQPIKAFKGLSFPENAAINIKLKDEAKAQWIGNLQAGAGGDPFIWDGRLFAMRIVPKWQSLNTYKTNNCGTNISNEIQEFELADLLNAKENRYKTNDYIQVNPESAPDLEEKRYLFNKSHLFTTSNGWKLNDNYQLNAQVTYLWNRLRSDNASRTTYFFEDSTRIVNESEASRDLKNELSGRLTLFANTTGYYLKNELQTNLRWNDTDINTFGDFANRQSAETPRYQLTNNLELIKRFGQQSVTFTSYNKWLYEPQQLKVNREAQHEYQKADNSVLFSNTAFAYVSAFSRFILTLRGGFKFLYRDFNSDLKGINPISTLLKNNTVSSYLNPYITPSLEYNSSSVKVTLNVPFHSFRYRFQDWVFHDKRYKNRFISAPSININYFITPLLTIKAQGSIGNKPLDESLFFRGYILQNYRNLQQGLIDFTTDKVKSVSAGIVYRNSLKSCFYNFNMTRMWTENAYINGRNFEGDYIVNTRFAQKNDRKSWILTGRFSKGIDKLHGMIAIDLMYINNRTSMMQDGIQTPYTSDWFTISPQFNFRPVSWSNIVYKCTFGRNILELPTTSSSSNRFTQSLEIVFVPTQQVDIKLKGEHYYNELNAKQSKTLFMADASFTYRISPSFEIGGIISNILDKKVYSYTLYDQLTNYDYRYMIRPRNYMLQATLTF